VGDESLTVRGHLSDDHPVKIRPAEPF